MATFALVYIFEDRHAFLWLYTTLEGSSHAVTNKLSVYYRVGSCPVLHLPGRDLISQQLSVHQEVDNGLSP